MNKIKIAIIGAGVRGRYIYGDFIERNKDLYEIVAVVDNKIGRREKFKEIFNLSEERVFKDMNTFFKKEKMADVVIVATLDNTHYEACAKALEKGYDVLVEGPVSNTLDKLIHLQDLCEKNNIEYSILPAVSFVDAMMDRLKIDPIEGLKIIDAFDIKNQILDKRIGTIITQVYNGLIASEVKLELLEHYNDDTEIIYVRAAGIEGQESIRKIPLYELDMQEDIDYLTSVYIPKDLNNKKDFYDFLEIIETLRGENGCPWDREQTHESIKNNLLEECYEVIEAIDKDDIDSLIEELGDILLHVVFHATIGKEDGYFNINDIIESASKKMIYRHPHVFKDENLETSEEVVANWEELKKKEKEYNTISEEIEGIDKT